MTLLLRSAPSLHLAGQYDALRPGIIQEIGNMSSLATIDTMESRTADIIRDDLINDLLHSTMSARRGDVFVLTILSSPFHDPSLQVPS